MRDGLEAAIALYGNSFPPIESIKALTYFEGGDLASLNSPDRNTLIDAAKTVAKPLIAKLILSKQFQKQ